MSDKSISTCQTELLINHGSKYLNTLTGRDKINRFIQFFSKYIAYRLSVGPNANENKEAIERLRAISLTAGIGRKLFRAGKLFDYFRSASSDLKTPLGIIATSLSNGKITSLLDNKETLLQKVLLPIMAGVKNICYGVWMTTDTLGLLLISKIVSKTERPSWPEWIKTGLKCWLTGLILSWISDFIALKSIRSKLIETTEQLRRAKIEGSEKNKEEISKYVSTISTLNQQYSKTRYAFVQNVIDTFLPLGSLGFLGFHEGHASAAGSITALMGAYTQWKATA